MKKLLLLAIVVLGISAVSFGQNSASSENNTASATIITPIIITKSGDLSFGTIGAKTEASKVVIATDASRNESTATLYEFASTQASVPTFHVKGTPDASFEIILPTSPTSVSGPTGSTPMTITDWKSNIVGGTVTTQSNLDSGGDKYFILTGTLNVGPSANQKAGQYHGTYNITVNYN